MSTKAEMISLVNSKLPSGSSIPASDHRDTMHTNTASAIENFYNLTVVTDTQLTTNVFTINGTDKTYRFYIKKQGGTVNLIGSFTNSGSTIVSDEDIADITLTEYQQNAISYTYMATSENGDGIRVRLATNTLTVLDAIAPDETVYIDITYNVNA